VHATSEEKIVDSKTVFISNLSSFFNHFPKYKILLGDFTVIVGGENIFKHTIGNKNLYQESNNNGIITANFATSKNIVFRA
jgi:hypothetical protein